MGSNLEEGMDVCKCIVPSRHEGTLNSRRAASPHVSHTKAIDDGHRNFEPWSNDEDDTRAGTTPSKLQHHDNVKTLNHMKEGTYISMHRGCSLSSTDLTCATQRDLEAPGLELLTHRPRFRSHSH
ncbi:hypothetical protein TNCV_1081501 [Trichonephila clavipes]|nr:hypothetical protein TNCV_1081501 [Trichonephila clavipes]